MQIDSRKKQINVRVMDKFIEWWDSLDETEKNDMMDMVEKRTKTRKPRRTKRQMLEDKAVKLKAKNDRMMRNDDE